MQAYNMTGVYNVLIGEMYKQDEMKLEDFEYKSIRDRMFLDSLVGVTIIGLPKIGSAVVQTVDGKIYFLSILPPVLGFDNVIELGHSTDKVSLYTTTVSSPTGDYIGLRLTMIGVFDVLVK